MSIEETITDAVAQAIGEQTVSDVRTLIKRLGKHPIPSIEQSAFDYIQKTAHRVTDVDNRLKKLEDALDQVLNLTATVERLVHEVNRLRPADTPVVPGLMQSDPAKDQDKSLAERIALTLGFGVTIQYRTIGSKFVEVAAMVLPSGEAWHESDPEDEHQFSELLGYMQRAVWDRNLVWQRRLDHSYNGVWECGSRDISGDRSTGFSAFAAWINWFNGMRLKLPVRGADFR